MKFPSFLLCTTLALFLFSSCSPEEEEKKIGRESRKPQASTKRNRADSSESERETSKKRREARDKDRDKGISFPVKLNANHTGLRIDSTDSKKITFTVTPAEQGYYLRAAFNGTISTNNTDEKQNIVLSSGRREAYMDLSVEETNILVADGDRVNAGQILAATRGVSVFYIEERGKLQILCFPIQELEKQIPVVENYNNSANCQEGSENKESEESESENPNSDNSQDTASETES